MRLKVLKLDGLRFCAFRLASSLSIHELIRTQNVTH